MNLPTNSFPLFPEIVSVVVDYLHDDQATLRSTALVSKQWLFPSQRHIFHSIRIGASRGDCTHLLIHFLDRARRHQHLTPLVHSFAVEWYRKSASTQRTRGPPRVRLPLLSLILQELPSLHTLELRSVDLHDSLSFRPSVVTENAATTSTITPNSTDGSDPLDDRTWPELPPLRTMSLVGVLGQKLTYSALFSRFPVSHTLHLLDSGFAYDILPPPTHPSGTSVTQPTPFSFHAQYENVQKLCVAAASLNFKNDTVALMYKSLFELPWRRLTRLDVGSLSCFEDVVYLALRRLIRERGQTIEYFRMDISQRERIFDGTLNFAQSCPSLQHLHLSIFNFNLVDSHSNGNNSSPPTSCVTYQLEPLSFFLTSTSPPPTSLRQLTLGIRKHPRHIHPSGSNTITTPLLPADLAGLARIDDALSKMHHQFGKFEGVNVQAESDSSFHSRPVEECVSSVDVGLREVVSGAVPWLRGRGMLRFV